VLGEGGAVWRFDLRAATRQRLGSLGASPTRCAFSGDGRHFIGLARDTALTIGDSSGATLWRPELPAAASQLEWGAAGHLVVVTSDGRIVLLDPVARKVALPPGLPAHAVLAVPAHDGRSLFVADTEGGVWQAALDGAPARLVQRLAGPANSLAVRQDGRALVLGSDLTAVVLDIETGAVTAHQFPALPGGPVYTRPAGDGVIMIGSGNQAVELWRPGAGEQAVTHFGDRGYWKTLVVSADGARAAWTNIDGSLYVADLAQEVARVFVGEPTAVRSIDLTPDGRWMVTVHGDRARVFALEEPTRLVWKIRGGESYARQLLPGRPGQILYGEDGGRLVIFDTRTRTPRLLATLDERAVRSCALPSGHEIAVCGELGGVAIVDLDSGAVRPIGRLQSACSGLNVFGDDLSASGQANVGQYSWDLATFTQRPDRPWGPASTRLRPAARPTLRLVSVLESPATARIVDTSTGELQALPVPSGSKIFAKTMAKDGNSASVGTADGRVWYWRVGDTGLRELGRLNGFVQRVLLAPDGASLYAGSEGGAVAAFRVEDGTRRTLGHHPGRVTALVQSESGALIASGDVTGEIRVFAPATGAVAVLKGHEDSVVWAAFVNEELLVSMDQRGQMRTWPLSRALFVPGDGPSLRAWLAELTTAELVGEGGAIESPMTTLPALP
jgi:WD40 repeat protein